jgi:hypothetical protein
VEADQGEEERLKKEQFKFFVHRNVLRAFRILKDIGDKSSELLHKR